jgi:hypothetical protein
MTEPKQPEPGLLRLARLNRTGVFLAALVVGLAGLFLPGWWGGLLLLGVSGGLVMLLRQTSAVTPPPLRVARLLIVAGLVVIAVAKIT